MEDRKVVSLTKMGDGMVVALCTDGSMWVSRINRLGKAEWRLVDAIPDIPL